MAMVLHDNYTSRFGLTNTSAAAEVAHLLGFNEETIRTMEYLDSIHAGKVIRKTLFSLITNVNRHFPDKIVAL